MMTDNSKGFLKFEKGNRVVVQGLIAGTIEGESKLDDDSTVYSVRLDKSPKGKTWRVDLFGHDDLELFSKEQSIEEVAQIIKNNAGEALFTDPSNYWELWRQDPPESSDWDEDQWDDWYDDDNPKSDRVIITSRQYPVLDYIGGILEVLATMAGLNVERA